ncbi:hypothetical protein [Neobacillus cucumis]|uniref:hypothetical protein n=1 Tax=Neobacillus cucumis TaxID=1740721 RepID=UPI002E1BCD2F|nr:hypothetical protein [Neobacillus cucumis]
MIYIIFLLTHYSNYKGEQYGSQSLLVHRRAEANAVLNIGGYIPAAILPVCTGYLIDVMGLTIGATAFAAILSVVAVSASLFVRTRLQRE